MVYLASEPFSRFYHANKCSFAFFLGIVVLIATLIFPGFVSFATHGNLTNPAFLMINHRNWASKISLYGTTRCDL